MLMSRSATKLASQPYLAHAHMLTSSLTPCYAAHVDKIVDQLGGLCIQAEASARASAPSPNPAQLASNSRVTPVPPAPAPTPPPRLTAVSPALIKIIQAHRDDIHGLLSLGPSTFVSGSKDCGLHIWSKEGNGKLPLKTCCR